MKAGRCPLSPDSCAGEEGLLVGSCRMWVPEEPQPNTFYSCVFASSKGKGFG